MLNSTILTWIVGITFPAILMVNGIVLSQQLGSNRDLGALAERFNSFDRQLTEHRSDVVKRFESSEERIGSSLEAFKSDLNYMRQHIEASQLDAGKILVTMGVVSPSDVFDTVAVNNSIWLIPSPTLKLVLERGGGKYEKISEKAEIYGFKIMPVKTILQVSP